MSEELNKVCEMCNFDEEFKAMLEGVEKKYNQICKLEQNQEGEQLTMVDWIMDNTRVDTLDCLNKKERFLYGLGILSSEIMNY